MANKHQKKPIVETDKPGGKVKKYWESAVQAAAFYNISQVIISYNVRGTTKQAKGHYFRFATAKEIEQFQRIIGDIDNKIADMVPVEPVIIPNNIPVDIIPETVKSDDDQNDTLSNFERLLEAGKKKLIDNSK